MNLATSCLRPATLSLALASAVIAVSGCAPTTSASPAEADAKAVADGARALVARVNAEAYDRQRESSAAGWVSASRKSISRWPIRSA